MERTLIMDINFSKNYAEILFFFVMVIGAIVGLSAPSAFISYIIVTICGLYAGRVILKSRSFITFPALMASIGFAIGFALVLYYGSRKIAIILYIIGIYTGYQVYKKKWLTE